MCSLYVVLGEENTQRGFTFIIGEKNEIIFSGVCGEEYVKIFPTFISIVVKQILQFLTYGKKIFIKFTNEWLSK